MVVNRLSKSQIVLLIFLALVLLSNFVLYRTSFIPLSINEETKWVVIGSLFDLAILAPILILLISRHKGISFKRFLSFMAFGLITAYFLIPNMYFTHFEYIAYFGFAYEIIIISLELFLIVVLVRHLPAIRKEANHSESPWFFAFPEATHKRAGKNMLIRIVTSEIIMFTYAVGSFRKKATMSSESFTLHKNSSALAVNIMLIHAVVIETIGFHWFLHEESFLLSIVLLILNIYTVLYFIGEIQAIRLNPLQLASDGIFVSMGLTKRMFIPFTSIEHVQWGGEFTSSKETIEFIANDFEPQKPHVVMSLTEPIEATMFMGLIKKYTSVAIRVDEPEKFKVKLEEQLGGYTK